jgi:hypothetical protein
MADSQTVTVPIADRAKELLGGDVHFVYHARGLIWEKPPGSVRVAPPLEEGLANPVRVTHAGPEQRHHGVIAMLGAKWYRDLATPAQLLGDPKDPAQRAAYDNRASALRFTMATGEHVVKLVAPHARPDSKPGAHLIYTFITKVPARAAAVAEEPGLLCALVKRSLEGYDHDLTGLVLARPVHDAHPSDLTSDPKLQRAFRAPRTDLAPRIDAAVKSIASLQSAMRAQMALLESTKATQRKQATSAFMERRTLRALSSEVEAEREELVKERGVTDAAFQKLDSRDTEVRESARKQLGVEIERAREERDKARAELAQRDAELAEQADRLGELTITVARAELDCGRLQSALAERDAALAEAEEIVQDLYRQIELLSKQGGRAE